jgi:hypothetical protein
MEARTASAASRLDVAGGSPASAHGAPKREAMGRPLSAQSSSQLAATPHAPPPAASRSDGGSPEPSAPRAAAGAAPPAPSTAPISASSRRLRPEAASATEAAEANAAAAARAAASRAADLRAQSQAAVASRLDERRLSQLHGDLVAERRRLKQPGKVSIEALGASLRETETKLKKQYADKAIDFRVVIKDGKAVVKPVIG